jgi:hypothetical protein
MITNEEKTRIKAFLLEKGIESEFVGTNHIAVLFRSTDFFTKTIPKFWRHEYAINGMFVSLHAEDAEGNPHYYHPIYDPVMLYETLEQAIRAMLRDYTFKT